MAIRSLNADCNISDQSIRKGAFLSASTEFSVRTPGVPDTGGTITGARLQITFFDSSGAFMCAFEGKSVIVDGVETSPSYIDVSSTTNDPDTYYITLERVPIPNTTLTKGDIQTLLDVYGFTNLKTQADVAPSFTRADTGVVFTTNATGSATFSTSIASSLRVGEQIAISNTTSGTNDGTFTIASIDTTTGVVTFDEATTSQTTNLDIDLVSRYLTTFNGGASSTFTNIAHSIAVDLIWTSTVQGDIVETRNTMLNRGQRVAPYSVPPNTFGGSTRKEIVLSSSRPYFVKELDGTITPSSLTVSAQLIGLEGPISWTTTNNAGTISSDTLSITFNNTTDLSSLPADNTLSVQAQVGEITELYYVTLLEAAINEKFVTAYAKGTSAPTRNASTGTYANPLSGQTADWSLTIPTLADGENLYTITRTFYSDNSASPDWSAATLFFQYVEGFAGKTVTATAPTQVFEYDGLGDIIGTPSTTVTANSFGFTNPEFRFAEGAAPTGAWGGATYSYDPANVYSNMPETIYVEAREVGGSAPEATDTITMSGLLPNQYTVILENEAHTVPADSEGTVSSFLGSGTVVRVYRGNDELIANDSLTNNDNQFRILVTSPSNILTFAATPVDYTGGVCTINDYTAMSADVGFVNIVVEVGTDGSEVFIANKVQTITKSKEGSDSYSPYLTSEAAAVLADKDGVVSTATLDTVTGTFGVLKGQQDDSSNWNYAVQTAPSDTNLIATINSTSGAFTFATTTVPWDSVVSDVENVTFRATKGSLTLDKTFTLTKSYKGQDSTVEGPSGLNNATVSLYAKNTSNSTQPTAFSGTFTYTFATGVLSGGTFGVWSQTPPSINQGEYLWIRSAVASSNTATDSVPTSDFSNAAVISGTGTDGLNQATVTLYQKNTNNSTPPGDPTGTFTYTFSSALLTGGSFNSWTQSAPSINGEGEYLWAISAVASSTGTTDSIPASEFSDAVVAGGTGTQGPTGDRGPGRFTTTIATANTDWETGINQLSDSDAYTAVNNATGGNAVADDIVTFQLTGNTDPYPPTVTVICDTGGNPGAWSEITEIIDGSLLVNGTVIADALNVDQLSAITADMGTITAGTITSGTFQTAASGQGQVRTVITSEAGTEPFVLYDAADEKKFYIDSTGKVFMDGGVGPNTISFDMLTTALQKDIETGVLSGGTQASGGTQSITPGNYTVSTSAATNKINTNLRTSTPIVCADDQANIEFSFEFFDSYWLSLGYDGGSGPVTATEINNCIQQLDPNDEPGDDFGTATWNFILEAATDSAFTTPIFVGDASFNSNTAYSTNYYIAKPASFNQTVTITANVIDLDNTGYYFRIVPERISGNSSATTTWANFADADLQKTPAEIRAFTVTVPLSSTGSFSQLSGLTDTNTTGLANLDLLQYNSSTQDWEPKSLSELVTGVSNTFSASQLIEANTNSTQQLELRPNSTTFSGYAANMLLRYRSNGTANYIGTSSNQIWFGTFNGGIPTDPSDMIVMIPGTNDSPELRVGDSGSTGAVLNVGGNEVFHGGNFEAGIDYQPVGSYLTSESDTLATVTARGATTGDLLTLTQASSPQIDFTATGGPLGFLWSAGKATTAQVQLVYRTTPETLSIEQVSSGTKIMEFDPSNQQFYAQAGTIDGATINSTLIGQWNTAFGWDDHSTQGYLTAESDTLATVTARGASTSTTLSLSSTILTGTTRWNVSGSDAAHQRVDARDDATDFARLHWYGRNAADTANDRVRWNLYDGSAYHSLDIQSGGEFDYSGGARFGGNVIADSGNYDLGSTSEPWAISYVTNSIINEINDIDTGHTLYRSSDNWLRLNPDGDFVSGIFCGSAPLRVDGTFQVGSGGSVFNLNGSSGQITASCAAAGGQGLVLRSTQDQTPGVTFYGPGLLWQDDSGNNLAGIRGVRSSDNTTNFLALGTGWLDQEVLIFPTYVDFAGEIRVSNWVTAASGIRHEGDENNNITFGTDTQTFNTAGTGRIHLTSNGENGYIRGNYAINSNDTGGGYSTCALEMREVGLVSNTQTGDDYAPAISFHWGGRNQGKLWMQGGTLNWTDGTGSGSYSDVSKNIATGTFIASQDVTVGGNSVLTTATSFGGDVSGTYDNLQVTNDSHTHEFNNLTSKDSGTGFYSTTGQMQAHAGFVGNYDDTTGSTWAGPIWGMDDGFTGATGGANSAPTSCYGLRWNRSSATNANSNIGEGLYVYQNGNLQGGIGTTGGYIDGALEITGNADFGSGIDVTGNITITSGIINHTTDQTRDKIRVWNSSLYAIGMDQTFTFGGLNGYAMTFQMNDTADRGWWWGHNNHSDSQGAMSLTNAGELAVATGIRVGYGISDTTSPTAGIQVSGDITATGTGTAIDWVGTSDARLKRNIQPLTNGLETVLNLEAVTHEWIDGKPGRYNGFIAQQVREIDPSLVTENEEGVLGVNYMKAVPVLVNAIQQLNARDEARESKLKDLEDKLDRLFERLG